MKLLTPFPLPLARNRLRFNLFLLILLIIIRTLFTPYTSLRRGIINLFSSRWPALGFSSLEFLLMVVLVWNILEAAVSVYYPSPASTTLNTPSKGMTMTPVKMSSPLTRAYPTTDRAPPSSLNQSTSSPSPYPRPQSDAKPLIAPHRYSIPTRTASPLSASTTKIFNLPPPTPPSSTGLFYDPKASSSPAQIGRQPQQDQPSVPGGDFVLIDRDEKEWVENVWKGVRGKGGRIGL